MLVNAKCTILRLSLGLTLASVSLTPSLAHADNWLGVGAGINLSNFTNADGVSGNTQFQGGVFGDWGLGDIWYLRTALRYNSYGLSGTTDVSGNSVNVSYATHYLEIPVLLKPTFNAGVVLPYLLVGPEFGIKIGESASASYAGQSLDVGSVPSIAKTFNFMVDFGAGVEIPFSPSIRGFVQFDYSLGVINVSQGDSADTRGANFTGGVSFLLM